MDEIDKFLSTLHIPEEMVRDPDRLPPRPKPKPQIHLTNTFPILAWVILMVSLLTVYRASPSGGNFFHSYMGRAHSTIWDSQLLFSAMCYLIGNCVVCAGGVAIFTLKKVKKTSAGMISLWIVGGVSVVLTIALMIAQ